jgi:hypothetical protein
VIWPRVNPDISMQFAGVDIDVTGPQRLSARQLAAQFLLDGC